MLNFQAAGGGFIISRREVLLDLKGYKESVFGAQKGTQNQNMYEE